MLKSTAKSTAWIVRYIILKLVNFEVACITPCAIWRAKFNFWLMNWVELAAPIEPSACSNHQFTSNLDARGPFEEPRTFFRHFEADEIPVEPLRYDCTPGSTPNAGKISPGPFQNYRPKIGPWEELMHLKTWRGAMILLPFEKKRVKLVNYIMSYMSSKMVNFVLPGVHPASK